jgi:predicted phosphoribosyltransferase
MVFFDRKEGGRKLALQLEKYRVDILLPLKREDS